MLKHKRNTNTVTKKPHVSLATESFLYPTALVKVNIDQHIYGKYVIEQKAVTWTYTPSSTSSNHKCNLKKNLNCCLQLAHLEMLRLILSEG